MRRVLYCILLSLIPAGLIAQIVHDENELMQIRDQLEQKRKSMDSFEDVMKRREEELKARREKVEKALKENLTARPVATDDRTNVEVSRTSIEQSGDNETLEMPLSDVSDEKAPDSSSRLPLVLFIILLIVVFAFKLRTLNTVNKKSSIRQLDIE